jgi:hypothetical protein
MRDAHDGKKLKAIQRIRFPQTLKELEAYLGMTGALRHFVEGYSWKAEPLQERKTLDMAPFFASYGHVPEQSRGSQVQHEIPYWRQPIS